ncbi:R3H domain-containing nucleic acid-binding protein [Streptobacillus felis]|uniref:Single-stranded DNA-binding protein n=1 Tax=Streptobacillus felis TaxID=1384509 RepID=A0A7Z0PE82_9FUSO|nr:R3H domain-containing nucleic acid-binding protein [Streptobacillus felis]NYV27639.1 single-stranded DNA-binding protein [Streptobacillus felis]
MLGQVLRSSSEEELREKIRDLITLADDETVEIKELKKPFKFLFFSKQGEYLVKIVKKSEKTEKIEKKEKHEKPVKKEHVKKQNVKKEKPVEKKVEQNPVKHSVEKDKIKDRLNVIIKEFLAVSNLNISIKEITSKDNVYKVELTGEEIRYIIGEKGISLSSLEYLLMSLEEFKNIKVFIDSNNYKEKRESILRELAQKTAKTVMKTQRKVKLNPMPSRERKIIHEEISKIPGLETISVGVEPKRCLIIKLKNKK